MILPWPISFAPEGWHFCQGQLLPIMDYQALYSLLGTMYGGNGTTTFGLPDLRGRTITGTYPGQVYSQGSVGGKETISLGMSTIPPHTHALSEPATTDLANTNDSTAGAGPLVFGKTARNAYGPPTAQAMPTNVSMPTGQGHPVPVMQPYLVLNYIICSYDGLYPSRP
ncbi:MAG: tail fiber protein [bacterium]|nr:tail fiber protein [bacterium]